MICHTLAVVRTTSIVLYEAFFQFRSQELSMHIHTELLDRWRHSLVSSGHLKMHQIKKPDDRPFRLTRTILGYLQGQYPIP